MVGHKVYPHKFTWNFDGGNASFDVTGLQLRVVTSSDTDVQVTMIIEHGNEKHEIPITDALFDGYVIAPGENKLTLIARDSTGHEIGRKTIVVLGEGLDKYVGAIKFELQGPDIEKHYPENLLTKAVAILSTANLFLDPESRISKVTVFWEPYLRHETMFGVNPTHPYQAEACFSTHSIDMSSIHFVNPRHGKQLSAVIMHEASHHVYHQMFHKQHNEVLSLISTFLDFRARRHFDLFDESQYMPLPKEVGHPYEGPGELFASASVILRYFPKDFMKKASILSEEDRALVLGVARRVVNLYLQHPNCPKDFFDPKLIRYLGLKFEIPIFNERFIDTLKGAKSLLK